ncbi:MAG: hypothetical protein AB1758_30335 [Candidatus Eremiobacterota bacterium]
MMWLLLTLPAVADREAGMGLAASALAMVLMWRWRSRYVPWQLTAETRARHQRHEAGPGTALSLIAPEPPTSEPTPELEPEPDLFQRPPAEAPELASRLDQARSEFERDAGRFLEQTEASWRDLEASLRELHRRYQSARACLTAYLNGLAERDALLAEAASRGLALNPSPAPCPAPSPPPSTSDPAEPPSELEAQGWSEPNPEGIRSRMSPEGIPEFLAEPAQPGGPRAYYRERLVEGMREIVRGQVQGKTLQLLECARWVDPASLISGEPHTLPPGVRIWGPCEGLEEALWTLPLEVLGKLPDLVLAPDLGGRVDWQGAYVRDATGRVRSNTSLAEPGRIYLRSDLTQVPALFRAALLHALGRLEGEDAEAWRLRWEPEPQARVRVVEGQVYAEQASGAAALARLSGPFPRHLAGGRTPEGLFWDEFALEMAE